VASKAMPHDLTDRPFLGTPRPLPFVLLCNARAINPCGRFWIANTMEQYQEAIEGRTAHEIFCSVTKTVEDLRL
jgi:hypothetical protein